MFQQAQTGDSESLKDLMRQHDGLVHLIIRRQSGGELSYGEVLHEGRIGLWRAVALQQAEVKAESAKESEKQSSSWLIGKFPQIVALSRAHAGLTATAQMSILALDQIRRRLGAVRHTIDWSK